MKQYSIDVAAGKRRHPRYVPCFAVPGQVAFVELLICNSHFDCIYEICTDLYTMEQNGSRHVESCVSFGDSFMFFDSKNQA